MRLLEGSVGRGEGAVVLVMSIPYHIVLNAWGCDGTAECCNYSGSGLVEYSSRRE